ncbi:D-alanyl-D-alanine carboxypeptidase family protein [Marispirochaeta sp.]|uniref:D-alanyl-D-alanine carboxypeptidase family protein n=1 Tax=Marispirochaeta sp. TaxID=2038653 RepID=UPI0029C63407|nr:D-alanyl-D-alanine carboxypeptidase family protein [Marispirochaeta sp.]
MRRIVILSIVGIVLLTVTVFTAALGVAGTTVSAPEVLSRQPVSGLKADGPPFNWTGSSFQPSAPEIEAMAAVLLDYETGAVLYSLNPDEILPPASLIKLLVMDAILDAVKTGKLDPQADIPIPPAAWSRNAPPRSSLMFLGPGQRASLDDLMLGLAIPSGNDAAVAAALLLDDSVEDFVLSMNRRLSSLGFEKTRMVEPSGYSLDNRTSAEEFARFSRGYIMRHPEAVEKYHSVPAFRYPRLENMLRGHHENTIYQQNFNRLLNIMPEADGLKTGTIPSFGYNLAATAQRNGRRLVSVVLGVQAESTREGNDKRARVSRELLEYGFSEYRLIDPDVPVPGTVRLYGAEYREVPLYIDAAWAREGESFVIPAAFKEKIEAELRVVRRLRGPIPAGAELGRLVYSVHGEELFSVPVRSISGAEQAAWWKQLADCALIVWERVQGEKIPPRVNEYLNPLFTPVVPDQPRN